jgi:restriction endonuclease S subunit
MSIGNRLLKKDFVKINGTVPAYSANVFKPFAYTEKSNIADFSAPYVIWGIDGNFEFNVISVGAIFATTDHCGAIKIKDPKLNPHYLAYMLEQTKHVYGFDRGLRASLTNMRNIEINVPIDKNGEFDVMAQEAIAEQYVCVNELRHEISDKSTELANLSISVDLSDYSMKNFVLSELLDPVKGKSKYTRKYGDAHKGEYPVFSASSNNPLTHIDTFDYDGTFLSWSTNGFAGTVIILGGKFSINGDRGILFPKSENVDIQYLKYTLEPLFRELAKGRKGDRGEDEFTKLYPSMISSVSIPLPIDENGKVSISAQQEIAAKYLAIEQYKMRILGRLGILLSQRIDY